MCTIYDGLVELIEYTLPQLWLCACEAQIKLCKLIYLFCIFIVGGAVVHGRGSRCGVLERY